MWVPTHVYVRVWVCACEYERGCTYVYARVSVYLYTSVNVTRVCLSTHECVSPHLCVCVRTKGEGVVTRTDGETRCPNLVDGKTGVPTP